MNSPWIDEEWMTNIAKSRSDDRPCTRQKNTCLAFQDLLDGKENQSVGYSRVGAAA